MYVDKKLKYISWGASILAALTLLTIFSYRNVFSVSFKYIVPLEQEVNNVIVLIILVIITLPAIVENNNNQWKQSVDITIPKLLRDITEAVRSGVPLIKALEDASQREYGPISKPLSAALIKHNLTTDFEASMTWLGQTLVQPSAKRMCKILVEAYESGGKIIDVLDTSVELFTHLVNYKEERNILLKPYTFIVYLGTFIFICISWVILTKFMMPLSVASADQYTSQPSFLGDLLAIDYYKAILFWAALMNGFFGGIIAGKMSNGRILTGLIHSVLLIIIATVFFNLFNV